MNVRCPNCQSAFRVDPERVPAGGIKARCSRCSTVFQLTREGVQRAAMAGAAAPASASAPAQPAPAPVQPPAPPAPSAPAMQAPPQPAAVEPAAAVSPPAPRPTPAPAAPAPAAAAAPTIRPIPTGPPPGTINPAPPPAPVAAPATSTKRPSFRNQDPSARAQRLARALVSDIVAYNKDKVKQSTGAAALRTEFRDEIRKSWEEYVEQVGLDLAKSTPFFRDALNEILAKGEKVF